MTSFTAGACKERGLFRTIISLTWPQLCALVCQMVIGLTDMWAGGRIGNDVQAAIGLIGQCQMLLLFIGFASANGAVAAVSQSFGARRPRRARRYVALIMAMTLSVGAVLGFVGFCFRPQLLSILHTPKEVYPAAMTFINATMLAMPGHYGMVIGSALFRSAQSVFLPLYVSILTCIVNVVGDLGFGLGMWGLPNCGAAGIAWSTTISVFLGTVLMIAGLYRQKLLRFNDFPGMKWCRIASAYLIKVTIPALGTSILWQMGYLLMFIIASSLPANPIVAVASLTSGIRIEALLFMPANACSMTAAVLVGHALGEGDKEQAMRIAKDIVFVGAGVVLVGVACILPFRTTLAGYLSTDPVVITATASYLLYNLIAEPCSFASSVLTGVFNGAGASVFPMRAFLVSIWGVRLPLSYYLGHIAWGSCEGIFCAMMISQFIQSSILIWFLFRKNWRGYAMRSSVHVNHNTKKD